MSDEPTAFTVPESDELRLARGSVWFRRGATFGPLMLLSIATPLGLGLTAVGFFYLQSVYVLVAGVAFMISMLMVGVIGSLAAWMLRRRVAIRADVLRLRGLEHAPKSAIVNLVFIVIFSAITGGFSSAEAWWAVLGCGVVLLLLLMLMGRAPLPLYIDDKMRRARMVMFLLPTPLALVVAYYQGLTVGLLSIVACIAPAALLVYLFPALVIRGFQAGRLWAVAVVAMSPSIPARHWHQLVEPDALLPALDDWLTRSLQDALASELAFAYAAHLKSTEPETSLKMLVLASRHLPADKAVIGMLADLSQSEDLQNYAQELEEESLW